MKYYILIKDYNAHGSTTYNIIEYTFKKNTIVKSIGETPGFIFIMHNNYKFHINKKWIKPVPKNYPGDV